MAIGNAVQRGMMIYVYDERGQQLFTKAGDLYSFTSGTVVVRKLHTLITYDERGYQIASTPG